MIYLRESTEADLPLMLAWRNSPLVYQGFYTQTEPLKWEEHLNWYRGRNKDWRTFIIVYVSSFHPRDIGVITIGQLDYWSPEIGWYIGEVSLWGKGLGTEAVLKAFAYLKERGYKDCHTTIKMNNAASLKLAWKVGFQEQCGAREGEMWLTKSL